MMYVGKLLKAKQARPQRVLAHIQPFTSKYHGFTHYEKVRDPPLPPSKKPSRARFTRYSRLANLSLPAQNV